MTLGTGIFLSVLVASICALLIATKEKWSWKKLFLYPALAILTLGALAILVFYGYSEGYYGPNKIGREMEYAGIKLRSTKSDVLFAKGNPASESPADEDGEVRLEFKSKDETLVVTLGKDGRVSGVMAFQEPDSYSSYVPSLKTINGWTSSAVLIKRLGEPPVIEDLEGGLTRVYRYPNKNLKVGFTKGRLELLGIRDYEKYPYKSRP